MEAETVWDQKYHLSVNNLTSRQPSIVRIPKKADLKIKINKLRLDFSTKHSTFQRI